MWINNIRSVFTHSWHTYIGIITDVRFSNDNNDLRKYYHTVIELANVPRKEGCHGTYSCGYYREADQHQYWRPMYVHKIGMKGLS